MKFKYVPQNASEYSKFKYKPWTYNEDQHSSRKKAHFWQIKQPSKAQKWP